MKTKEKQEKLDNVIKQLKNIGLGIILFILLAGIIIYCIALFIYCIALFF
jgi:hypothetical protein